MWLPLVQEQKINIPLMISGMFYGTALIEEVRLSLAEAAHNVETAMNPGEGALTGRAREVMGLKKNEVR
ncbi:glutamate synthase-related protein [Bacillus australimaris]|uniref:glutamate synthase-related protein n=1 Tax=Bacillus australimaris TaxID=1326968 RepID=UPI0039B678BA